LKQCRIARIARIFPGFSEIHRRLSTIGPK
jgi:hypothetical protein